MNNPTGENEFELLIEKKPAGLIRRYFITQRHFIGLFIGGLYSHLRSARESKAPFKLSRFFLAIVLFFIRPFFRKKWIGIPFSIQLRKRMETLGPTYIKLGQILSLREDILPKAITDELKNLLDKLPVVTIERYKELIEQDLKTPTDLIFPWINPNPVGSASIAQTHMAKTIDGDEVILKVIKPGIRQTIETDIKLLKFFGSILQLFFGRFQPKRVIKEFCHYTLKEVDLRLEADNAETFTANFSNDPNIHFPKIYRQFSGRSVLCMEFLDGIKPDEKAYELLNEEERKNVVKNGASAIINMLYRDGFFHADLHPGNLIILDRNRCGFIDLGMIGRFDEDLKKTLLYYFYSLVMGDAPAAARFLTAVSYPGKGGDPEGFRRAVEDISTRWHRVSNFKEFSLARLIMESTALGGQYRMYFPIEMVLMVKALITFEGVGSNIIA